MVLLPIALPGIVTGIALRSSFVIAGVRSALDAGCRARDVLHRDRLQQRGRSVPTDVAEHHGGVRRPRRDGLADVPACRAPNLATALFAGGILAFALSFDEIVVTTFTAGNQQTLPIWIFERLFRPRQRPVTNVAAILVIVFTFVPVPIAQLLTREERQTGS